MENFTIWLLDGPLCPEGPAAPRVLSKRRIPGATLPPCPDVVELPYVEVGVSGIPQEKKAIYRFRHLDYQKRPCYTQVVPPAPNTPEWEAAANRLARRTVTISPCGKCGGPVRLGYICSYCPDGGY